MPDMLPGFAPFFILQERIEFRKLVTGFLQGPQIIQLLGGDGAGSRKQTAVPMGNFLGRHGADQESP